MLASQPASLAPFNPSNQLNSPPPHSPHTAQRDVLHKHLDRYGLAPSEEEKPCYQSRHLSCMWWWKELKRTSWRARCGRCAKCVRRGAGRRKLGEMEEDEEKEDEEGEGVVCYCVVS